MQQSGDWTARHSDQPLAGVSRLATAVTPFRQSSRQSYRSPRCRGRRARPRSGQTAERARSCKRDIALLKQLFEVEEGPGLPIMRFRLDCSHQDIWPMPRRGSDLDPSCYRWVLERIWRLRRSPGIYLRFSRSAVWGCMVTQRSSSAKPAGSTDQPIVFVVDDDASMRQALARLLQSVQLRVEVFASPQEFLQSERPDIPSCLVLDVRLPGLSGLDFQAELLKADVRMPIVFITGHGDIPMSVRAMKAGAVDFLVKPFRDQDLLDAVTTAIQRDQKRL